MCIHIYIYVICLSLCIYIYIYTHYIYVYIHVLYIYIYIHMFYIYIYIIGDPDAGVVHPEDAATAAGHRADHRGDPAANGALPYM